MAIKFDLMTLGLRAHNHPIGQGCPTLGPPVRKIESLELEEELLLDKASEIKYIVILLTSSNTSSSTEAQAINILLPNHTITLVNVYHPDNSPIDTNILSQNLASISAMYQNDFGENLMQGALPGAAKF
ncbi:hypothetical protein TNCV_2901891 [Trichonephila clavipes]|nr:hypothetical protein TNCV_2901891 [Trichonephila clavipes]